MDLNDLLNGLMADMRKVVSDSASGPLRVGEPLKVGKSQMVPLLGVTIAFGTAATDLAGNNDRRGARADGAGAGGTMVVTPKAFVVVGEDGIPQLIALKDGKYGAVRKAIELEIASPSSSSSSSAAPAQITGNATPPKLPTNSGGGSNP